MHDGGPVAVYLGSANEEIQGSQRYEISRIAGQAAVEIGGHCQVSVSLYAPGAK